MWWEVPAKMNNFSYLLKQGLSSVWKNRLMSFASLCILTVSLLLVGLSAFIMLDCGIILDNVSDKNEISVYMEDDADINHIKDVLDSNSLVTAIRYISPEEGLETMKEQYKEQTELFDSLPYNPVPPTYMVTINDLDKIDMAVSQFQAIQGVYKVNAPMDFAGFIEDIRKKLAKYAAPDGIAFVDAYIAENPSYWVYYEGVNRGKAEVAQRSPLNVLVDTIAAGLTCAGEPEGSPDMAHYDSLSEIKLGHLFAEQIATFLD